MESHLPFFCPICYELFNQTERIPRIIPTCGHTVCSQCLLGLLTKQALITCPFDKKRLTSFRVEDFPVNFILFQIFEEKNHFICSEHNQKLLFACYTDQSKICSYCICEEKHRSHNIEPLNKIKTDITEKKKELEKLIQIIDEVSSQVNQVLEEKRIKLKELLEKSMNSIDYFKGSQMIVVSNLFFKTQKMNIIAGISSIKTSITEKLSDLNANSNIDNLLKDPGYLPRLEQTIDEWKRNLEKVEFLNKISKLAQIINDDTSPFIGLNFQEQEQILSKLHLLFNEPIMALLSMLTTEETIQTSKTHTACYTLSSIKSFEIQTSLRFQFVESHLEVRIDDDNSKIILIDLESWQEARELRIKMPSKQLDEENSELLMYIWASLDNISVLKVKLETLSPLDDKYNIVLKDNKENAEIEINLERHKITEQTKTNLLMIAAMLPKYESLRKVSLVMNQMTSHVGSIIHLILTKMNIKMHQVEDFSVFLNGAHVNDEDIKSLFVAMPIVKKLTLYLTETKITNATVKRLAENTLMTISSPQEFTLSLAQTEVNDENMSLLFFSLKGIKKLELDLGFTKITDETLTSLARDLSESWKELELLTLSLVKTKVTDESLSLIFKPMPKIKSFFLCIINTTISDKAINQFAQNTLVSMKVLENLIIWLGSTNITDLSMSNMLQNVPNVRQLSLNLTNTKISDNGIKPWLEEKLPKMTNLKELNIALVGSSISQQLRSEIRERSKSLVSQQSKFQ